MSCLNVGKMYLWQWKCSFSSLDWHTVSSALRNISISVCGAWVAPSPWPVADEPAYCHNFECTTGLEFHNGAGLIQTGRVSWICAQCQTNQSVKKLLEANTLKEENKVLKRCQGPIWTLFVGVHSACQDLVLNQQSCCEFKWLKYHQQNHIDILAYLLRTDLLCLDQVGRAVRTDEDLKQWVSLGDLVGVTCMVKPMNCGEGAVVAWIKLTNTGMSIGQGLISCAKAGHQGWMLTAILNDLKWVTLTWVPTWFQLLMHDQNCLDDSHANMLHSYKEK